jgi:Mlc titration factor MtfA (ptsG expression regulator)
MFSFFRNRRRRKLLDEPFPPWWDGILKRNVGHYARLSPPEQAKLRDILRILIAEKKWDGARGMFCTDEVKVTIAAQAALLLLGIEHDYYARVDSLVVYPDTFRTPNPEDDWEDDELSDFEASGQAVYRGPVILSWREVLDEGRDPACGYNVVVHEFAHQLDYLDNTINGTPPLADKALEARWQSVMQAAFDRHRQALDRREDTFFTEHAAENETEFFADASEAYFCKPHDLREEEPDVFELLKAYYRVDPLAWFPDAGADHSSFETGR